MFEGSEQIGSASDRKERILGKKHLSVVTESAHVDGKSGEEDGFDHGEGGETDAGEIRPGEIATLEPSHVGMKRRQAYRWDNTIRHAMQEAIDYFITTDQFEEECMQLERNRYEFERREYVADLELATEIDDHMRQERELCATLIDKVLERLASNP